MSDYNEALEQYINDRYFDLVEKYFDTKEKARYDFEEWCSEQFDDWNADALERRREENEERMREERILNGGDE